MIIEAAKAAGGVLIENLLDLDFGGDTATSPASQGASQTVQSKTDNLLDLMSMDIPSTSSGLASSPSAPQETFLTPESAQGLSLTGAFAKR